jgi:hypothetical protein
LWGISVRHKLTEQEEERCRLLTLAAADQQGGSLQIRRSCRPVRLILRAVMYESTLLSCPYLLGDVSCRAGRVIPVSIFRGERWTLSAIDMALMPHQQQQQLLEAAIQLHSSADVSCASFSRLALLSRQHTPVACRKGTVRNSKVRQSRSFFTSISLTLSDSLQQQSPPLLPALFPPQAIGKAPTSPPPGGSFPLFPFPIVLSPFCRRKL